MSKIYGDILDHLVGKKIIFKQNCLYCNIEDWFSDDIPEYMEVINGDVYFKPGVELKIGKSTYTGYPTLGPDEIDFVLEDEDFIEAEIID